MDTPSIKAFYDRYVGQQMAMGVNERHLLIRDLAVSNGLRDGMHVLELGCGIGTLTGLLAELLPHGKLVAVDLSSASIEQARSTLGRYKQLDLRVADVVLEPIPGPFDLIILPDILEHIPLDRQADLLAHVKASLAPEGLVLIHSPDPYYSDWVRLNKPELLQIIDLSLHLPALVKAIDDTGLALLRFQRHSIWWSTPDYMALVLTHSPAGRTFRPLPVRSTTLGERIMQLISKTLRTTRR